MDDDNTALSILRQRPAASARPVVESVLSVGVEPARSLYIHVPFCFHKCHYCDFYSFVDTQDRQGAFVDRLLDELQAIAPLAADLPLRTVFIGGGTPTLLDDELWRRLLESLAGLFDLSLITSGRGEFTVECNPETARPELFDILVAGGVNRISIGAQTFTTEHLRTLERHHHPDSVGRAVELADAAGILHRSVDLIYAIPGQTESDVAADLDTALSLPIDHVSAYNLTYEPQTAMTFRMERGDFAPADEDTELAMFWLVRERCLARGFEAYEVSNFARPGGECRHNLAYWRQEQWIAAGPSASAHVGGHRYKVIPRLTDYLDFSDDGFAPMVDHESPDASRALAEIIMTGIRLSEGIDVEACMKEAEALGAHGALGSEIDAVRSNGWLADDTERLVLNERGLPLADHIASCLMSALG
ncbi:MAG: radical SAM family heme chaperone HemW [Planctomycetota bacterium]